MRNSLAIETFCMRLLGPVLGTVLLALIGQALFGTAYIYTLLSSTKTSSWALILFGSSLFLHMLVGGYFAAAIEKDQGLDWRVGIWAPVQAAVLASSLFPLYPGPLGEPIGALPALLLSIVSATSGLF